MHGRTNTWVDMACYGILLKPGCSSHRCIQHRLWHFRSATSSCPQCASLRWPRMVAIHSWQQRSPQLVEKWRYMNQATQSLGESVSSSSDVLMKGCPAHTCAMAIYHFIADMLSLQMKEYKTNAKHPITSNNSKTISNVVTVQPRKNTLENFATRRKHTQGKTNGKGWSLVQLPGFSWTRVACLTAWNWSNKASIRWRRASKGVRQSLLTKWNAASMSLSHSRNSCNFTCNCCNFVLWSVRWQWFNKSLSHQIPKNCSASDQEKLWGLRS